MSRRDFTMLAGMTAEAAAGEQLRIEALDVTLDVDAIDVDPLADADA